MKENIRSQYIIPKYLLFICSASLCNQKSKVLFIQVIYHPIHVDDQTRILITNLSFTPIIPCVPITTRTFRVFRVAHRVQRVLLHKIGYSLQKECHGNHATAYRLLYWQTKAVV